MALQVLPGAGIRAVIAGGGTGGHLYPGIAVARELQARTPAAIVTFAGTARGIEAAVIPREGFDLDLVRSAGLIGKPAWDAVKGLALVPASLVDAWRVVWRRSPHVVVGVGGYSSGAVVLVAALRGIPTLLLEQNAVPGVTNRLLARVVRAAAVSHDATLPYFRGKGFVSGNPVRREFFEPEGQRGPGAGTAGGPVRILAFGGSRGAHAINEAMVTAAETLARSGAPVSITHQTGERDVEVVRAGYGRAGVEARIEPFLFDMHREMRAADVLVCRAGATTVAEIAAVGRPAILIPLPTATHDHQCRNAEVLARAGAAQVIDQTALSGQLLAQRLLALIRDEPKRRAMAAAARRLARPDAARVIVDCALALVDRARGMERLGGV